MNPQTRTLLHIVELGGYPDFTPLFRELGYGVEVITSGRKAISYLKQHRPDVILAEFNYIPDFRDRTSALESVLATVQRLPETRVIVLYHPGEQAQFDKLRARFSNFEALPLPVDEAPLRALLA